jgi:hypothetical protein
MEDFIEALILDRAGRIRADFDSLSRAKEALAKLITENRLLAEELVIAVFSRGLDMPYLIRG